MVKTILVLKDGTEVMAGREQENAIQSVTVEEACNDSQDLMIGSTCSAKVVVDIITPRNKMVIDAGEQFELFEEENGIRRKKGVFNAEKPQKKNSNVTRIEAYDNISLLDKDVTEWFNSLNAFPYTAYNMANLVCIQCGLLLLNESIPNGDFLIQETEFDTVTARQIIRWIAEISGCFCVANCDGQVWYRWYQPNNTPITPNKSEDTTMFLGGGLKYEDYQTQKIDAVRIIGDNEMETVYPTNLNASNVYIIDGNPFLSEKTDAVMRIAESLYNVLKDMAYTPCVVDVPASFVYGVGDIVDITDANGVNFSALVMQKSRSGQKERIEATGNAKRNGATELYDTGFKKTYSETRKNKKSIADIKTEASSNRASIEAFAEWQANITNDDGTLKVETSLSSFEAYAEENYAKTSMLSQYSTKGETGEAISEARSAIEAEVSNTYATISALARLESDTSSAVSEIRQKATDNEASIEEIVSYQDGLNSALAQTNSTVSAQGAKIETLTSWSNGVDSSLASVTAKANKNSAQIGLVVDVNNNIKGSVIVEAINGQSSVKIDADILDIDVSDKVTIGDSIVIARSGSLTITDGVSIYGDWNEYKSEYLASGLVVTQSVASAHERSAGISPTSIYISDLNEFTSITSGGISTQNVYCDKINNYRVYFENGFLKGEYVGLD